MGYTNSVDLPTDNKKTDIDNMLLSYSTGSYVDYSVANKESTTGDASTSGNLDVSKVLDLQRHPTEYHTIPLVITNTNSSGAGFIGEFVSTVKGCLFEYLTSASSTSWWQGILGGSNEFVLKTGSNGLTIKPTGYTTSGNLDVGAGASSSKNKNILMILGTLAICKWRREVKPTVFYNLKLITNMVQFF